jgi:hypothetical protein
LGEQYYNETYGGDKWLNIKIKKKNF